MPYSPRFLVAAMLMVLASPQGAGPQGLAPLLARQPDTEEDLLSRIERERNPVKKAKYEIRLGRVKLFEAIDAYGKGDLERCQALLADYLNRMKSSWETLQSSGRQAVKQPQGFKELDIALREDARLLEDLAHRVPYAERGPVEKTVQEVERMRSEVLRALFPEPRPAARGKFFVRFDEAHFVAGIFPE